MGLHKTCRSVTAPPVEVSFLQLKAYSRSCDKADLSCCDILIYPVSCIKCNTVKAGALVCDVHFWDQKVLHCSC